MKTRFTKPRTISEIEEQCISDISENNIEIPLHSFFTRTANNFRFRYFNGNGLVKLNTNSKTDSAELLQLHGLIDGFDANTINGTETVCMYRWSAIKDGNLTMMHKAPVMWDDIDLTAAECQRIAALYEYQKIALSNKVIRHICIYLFRENDREFDQQIA